MFPQNNRNIKLTSAESLEPLAGVPQHRSLEYARRLYRNVTVFVVNKEQLQEGCLLGWMYT